MIKDGRYIDIYFKEVVNIREEKNKNFVLQKILNKFQCKNIKLKNMIE